MRLTHLFTKTSYCMDTEKQEESIKKLVKLKNVHLVFTAYGDIATILMM